MKTPAALLTSALLAALTLCAAAQKMATPAGEAPGPWLLGTIGVGEKADGTVQTTALKGLAIKVGAHGEAAVAYACFPPTKNPSSSKSRTSSR